MFNKGDLAREYLAPLLVVLTLGGFGFYVWTKVDAENQGQRIVFVEKQVAALHEMVTILQSIRIELSRRGEWMDRTDEAIDALQMETADRYTKTDAKKDLQLANQNLMFITRSLERLEIRIKNIEERGD